MSEILREAMVAAYQQLQAAGLGTGSSGNLSQRCGGGMLITPTGVGPAELEPSQVVSMSLEGECESGQLLPSSEWHLHAAIYLARPDINAVVHCHSRHATILACTHRPLPAVHYMIAITAMDEIPIAPYATFGTLALAASTAAALGEKGLACLLANHGQVAAGADLSRALRVALEVEELAAIYCGTLAIGGAQVLSPEDMAEVHKGFAHYGQQD
ncbi:MAG: class II aldolase/adducin family protein [Pseudomonadales bacterium]|nr:class II aldolase/adducin family protein [Halioglobus sp.]MCP5130982.1 class II aldolase/adducin family protein [Pseudomonadales bacterium]